jgi:hypothetical protein
MMKRWLGVFAALTMVGSAMACSSSSDVVVAPPKDTGVATDSKTDTKTDGPTPVDAPKDLGGDAGCTEDKTVGKTCATDDECDVTGAGVNKCTNTLFTAGTLYPTPVCFGTSCDPGDGTTIKGCDCDAGVCLKVTSGGYCLPFCNFDDSGKAPTGCQGKDICNVYGWGTDATTKAVTGVGYCFGGCHADADCTAGNKCQIEDGLCVKTLDVYTLKVGDACTKADSTAKKCNCLYATASGTGYCTTDCKVGDTTWGCTTGFTCDPMLPKKDAKTGDPLFTKAPAGMSGYCLKNCTVDGDCTALGGYCEEMAGTGQKTCQIGTRP